MCESAAQVEIEQRDISLSVAGQINSVAQFGRWPDHLAAAVVDHVLNEHRNQRLVLDNEHPTWVPIQRFRCDHNPILSRSSLVPAPAVPPGSDRRGSA